MRIWLKWIGIILSIPIILILLIPILLYIPPLQNSIVKKAARYASEASGMDIGIEKVRLSFPLDISVYGVKVITPPSDTLCTLQNLSVRINPIPLLDKIVSIDQLNLSDLHINTGTYIDGMEVKGVVGDLSTRASINLTERKAHIPDVQLANTVATLCIDSASQSDSTSPPPEWVLDIGNVSLNHICFGMQMPTNSDTLRLGTYIGKADIFGGIVDLGISRYSVEQFALTAATLTYDEAGKQSDLSISSLKGSLHSDSVTLSIPDLHLTTPHSEIQLLTTIPWSLLDSVSEGNMQALVTASIGKKDLFSFVDGLPSSFIRSYPDSPLNVAADITGNLSTLNLRQLKVELPGALVVNASGKVGEVMDNMRRSADIRLQAQNRNVNFALKMLPVEQQKRFRIPQGLKLSGTVGFQNQQLQTNLLLTEDKARIHVDANYHITNESYLALLKIDSLEPNHFLPQDSLMWISAAIRAEGAGTDFFADRTWLDVNGRVDSFSYVGTQFSDIGLTASLKEHQFQVEMVGKAPTAMDISLSGTIRKDDIQATLIADVDSLDLYALHLTDKPLSTSFQLFGQAESDLQKTHKGDLTIGNWEIRTDSQFYKPKTLTLLARTNEDTTRVSLHAGDLSVVLTGNAELTTMIDKVNLITTEVNTQLQQDSTVNIAALRPYLPDMNLAVAAGNDNPIYNLLQQSYIGFSELYLDASASPEEGLRMDAGLFTLHRDTFKIDTIRAAIRSDSAGLLYQVDAYKNRYRQQLPFTAHINGFVGYKYIDAKLLYKDYKDSVGVSMGIKATKESDHILFRFAPERQIVAFNAFRINPDNYIRFKNIKEIEADVRFTGKNNASLWLHSEDSEGEYPELHAELSQIDLEAVSDGFPQVPEMAGVFSADIRYAPVDETFLVVLDANVDNLFVRKGRIGEIMLNGVYLPLDDGNHQIDVHLSRDSREAATATAIYRPNDVNNAIDGRVDITTLPLSMLSPFIPDNMASLRGALNSQLLVTGSTSKPVINGYMQLDTSSVFVNQANSEFRISDDRIEVQNSIMTFKNYSIYAANSNPLTLAGNVNFSNLSRMMADMRLTANNLQLLDARRTSKSLVYGKVLVNLSTTLKGPLNALSVRGDIHLLGGTNATYVLTDSPLTVHDRLTDLVTFTSFADTVFRTRQRQAPLPLGGTDMLMVLHIDPAVRLRVDLTSDQSNYAEVVGGGDLSFQYTPLGDMVLNGRYTFNEGLLNYELPVVPLKEFHIAQDSYIQWDGEVMNPLVNVKATERMRVSAKAAGETSPRMVYFNVGLQANERLENIQPQFIISAEDGTIANELASMGPEERSKQAVAMMVTGSYLYGGGGGGMNLDVNTALNTFLTSEINNIAGDALKSVDISFGMDTYEQDGNTKRDFSFQFARRFYNDRIRVVVGGRVSTGGNTQETEPFLDNVSVEYRLDQAGSANVKLFHDRNYVSVLEGEITETGAGIIFRKKMKKLRELFDFRKKKVIPINEDTL